MKNIAGHNFNQEKILVCDDGGWRGWQLVDMQGLQLRTKNQIKCELAISKIENQNKNKNLKFKCVIFSHTFKSFKLGTKKAQKTLKRGSCVPIL